MTVANRLRALINVKVNDRTRYISLKEMTGISSDIWKNFWFGRREADAHMVEKICRVWPEHAFWLSTGGTDAINGHISIESELQLETQKFRSNAYLTDRQYMHAMMEATQAFEDALNYTDVIEDQNLMAAALKRFIDGEAVHNTTGLNYADLDNAFKKIKALRKIGKLRESERWPSAKHTES